MTARYISIVLEADPRDPFVAPGMTATEVESRIKAVVASWDRGIKVYVAGPPSLKAVS